MKRKITTLALSERAQHHFLLWPKGIAERVAFTLIELLIVVTLIAIVGVASFSGLSRILDMQDTETSTKTIAHTLESFDQAVRSHEITSYETVFESGSLWFIVNTDWYKKTSPVKCSFDFSKGTGAVMSTDTGTGIWELVFSGYGTSGKTYTLPANGGVQTFSFPLDTEKKWYRISNGIGDVNLNSFLIQYYHLTKQGDEMRLLSISGSVSGWGEKPYSSLIIRNVLGKKVLLGSSTTVVDTLGKATLLFEKNGKEMEMVILL